MSTFPPYMANQNGWMFFIDNKPVSVPAYAENYAAVSEAVMEQDVDKLRNALTVHNNMTRAYRQLEFQAESDDFRIMSDGADDYVIYFRDNILPPVLVDKLISMWKAKMDMGRYVKFVERIYANPRPDSIAELFDFLAYAELPITDKGTFIAYKGVRTDLRSVHGNTETRILQGSVDQNGRITNHLNDVIEAHINDVDPDRRKECSNGLHVGSYEYAAGFAPVVLAVEVDPADVVSVPTDYCCQKCRVSKYRVLNEVSRRYEEACCDISDEGIVDNDVDELDDDEWLIDEDEVKAVATAEDMDSLLSADEISKTRDAIERNISNHAVVTISDEDGAKMVRVYGIDDPRANAEELAAALFAKGVDATISVEAPATTIAQLCGSVGRKEGVTRAAMLVTVLRLGYSITKDEEALGNSIVKF